MAANATFYAVPAAYRPAQHVGPYQDGHSQRIFYVGCDPIAAAPAVLEDETIEATITAAMARWEPHQRGQEYDERVLPAGIAMPYPQQLPRDVLAVRITLPAEQVEALTHEIRLDPDNVYVRAAAGAAVCAADPGVSVLVRERLIAVAHIVGGMPSETIVHHWRCRRNLAVEQAEPMVSAACARADRTRAVDDARILADAGLGLDPDDEQTAAAVAALAATMADNSMTSPGEKGHR